MQLAKKEKVIEHPLEAEFDIEPGTTMIEYTEVLPAEPVKMIQYDDKDDEIEGKLEEIYSVAMGNVADIADQMDRVEGKFKARIGEVTAAMLNVALGAVREKSQLKQHKDKLFVDITSAGTPHTVNNNLVTANLNEILKLVRDKKKVTD